MSKKLIIPKFKSEAQEAQWWYDHRDETTREMADAVAKGRTTTLRDILQQAKPKSGPTPMVSIRIDPADLSRARRLAGRKGLRYQTYLKMLLHEALLREEKRRGGWQYDGAYAIWPAAASLSFTIKWHKSRQHCFAYLRVWKSLPGFTEEARKAGSGSVPFHPASLRTGGWRCSVRRRTSSRLI
jgi:hypothetical protein